MDASTGAYTHPNTALERVATLTDPPHELLDIFRCFPGIHAASAARPTRDGGVALAMRYEDHLHGKIAQLVVAHIATRVGARQRSDEVRCDAKQVAPFARLLNYASLRPMGTARPPTTLSATPLPTLLSHALVAFTADYEQLAGDDEANPHLGVWANALRVIDEDGLEQRELGPKAILAQRAVRVVVRDLVAQRWLELTRTPAGRGAKLLRLTAAGRSARDAGAKLATAAERRWRRRFGAATIDGLRTSLTAAANAVDVELPFYLTGYGPSDGNLTGGPYLREEPGPPRIPARGEEWPVVPRSAAAGNEPLFALLSIALAAFTIDYERERLGDLRTASTLLQGVPDDGAPLPAVRDQGVVGNGRSTLERHLVVVVEPRQPGVATRLVHPTPKARRSRDAYPALAQEIERNWQTQLGAKTVANLRTQLETVDAKLEPTLPAFPDPLRWFRQLHDRNP